MKRKKMRTRQFKRTNPNNKKERNKKKWKIVNNQINKSQNQI